MSDAMSFAEVGEQYVELLPARTVLSLLPAGLPGANGDSGTHGSNGKSMSGFTLSGMIGSGGSDSNYPYDASDTGSGANSSHS